MTPASLSVLYRRLSLVVLLLGMAVPYLWMEGTVWNKVGKGLMINLEFHLCYQFMSRLPMFAYRRISRRGPVAASYARQGLIVFTWMVMATSVFGLVDFLNRTLKNKDLVGVVFSLTYVAVFLGAYMVWLKLRAISEVSNAN